MIHDSPGGLWSCVLYAMALVATHTRWGQSCHAVGTQGLQTKLNAPSGTCRPAAPREDTSLASCRLATILPPPPSVKSGNIPDVPATHIKTLLCWMVGMLLRTL